MVLTQIVEKEASMIETPKKIYEKSKVNQYETKKDGLFCEQYLEKPVISGDYEMAISPTACTIKGIPVIDDY